MMLNIYALTLVLIAKCQLVIALHNPILNAIGKKLVSSSAHRGHTPNVLLSIDPLFDKKKHSSGSVCPLNEQVFKYLVQILCAFATNDTSILFLDKKN